MAVKLEGRLLQGAVNSFYHEVRLTEAKIPATLANQWIYLFHINCEHIHYNMTIASFETVTGTHNISVGTRASTFTNGVPDFNETIATPTAIPGANLTTDIPKNIILKGATEYAIKFATIPAKFDIMLIFHRMNLSPTPSMHATISYGYPTPNQS